MTATVRATSATRAVHVGGAFGRPVRRHRFSVEVIDHGVVRQDDGFFYFSPAAIMKALMAAGAGHFEANAIVEQLLEQAKAAEVQ